MEQAFATEMHNYQVAGELHHANAVAASIPRALASVVNGVVSLHDFRLQAAHRRGAPVRRSGRGGASPQATYGGGTNYLAPADFATIYNVGPLYDAGVDGTGQAIAIVGRTDIVLSDVEVFRRSFGLSPNDPIVIHNGPPPGDLGGDEELEADLDTEWSGAVAPQATIFFVVSASTAATDGVYLSAQYIVDNDLAPVMSTSFGECESAMGSANLAFVGGLWAQAATQGITALVSSGDAGAAGCNGGGDWTGSGLAVSGLCSTPNDVCVGGTEFVDTANPALYWSPTSDPVTQASALSYIPEMVWNESGANDGAYLWSSGGGASSVYAKPYWQVAPGVPSDGVRDIPDVALSAALHDGYLIEQGGDLNYVGGTSAASPSFAGLIALVVQQTGARQGNANTSLYPIAANQFHGSGAAAFHDITVGNNSVPGVTGYASGLGYDQATGLGSVDAAALLAAWGGAAECHAPPVSTALAASAHGAAGFTLTWGASPGATQYLVLRASAAGGPYSLAGLTADTTWVDSGLACGITYYYAVVAGNGTCLSARSAPLAAATGACGSSCTTLYSANFESGSGLFDWTAGGADWRGIQACPAHSGSHVFRFGGATCSDDYANNDYSMAQPQGATGIIVPAGTVHTRLSFWHAYDFETGYDGGTLMATLNLAAFSSGRFFYVPSSAILSGASYNGRTASDCVSPLLAGVPVFTGTQSSFVNTIVDLDSMCDSLLGVTSGCAGLPLQIAFTAISDCTNGGTGWSLDDVAVTTCQAPMQFYTVTPCRVIDTRKGTALAGNSTTNLTLADICGVPITAKAISANVTVVAPQYNGFLTIYPGSSPTQPGTSTLNFRAGQVLANNAMLLLGGGNYYSGGGTINVYVDMPGGVTDLLIDVNGYYQ